MLDQQTEQFIKGRVKNLPPSTRAVISSGNHSRTVASIIAPMQLDSGAQASIQLEVLFVLLGLQTVAEFEDEVINRSVLSAEQGREFAKRMRDELFTALAPNLPDYTPEEQAQSNTLATVAAAIETYGLVRERLERLPQGVQATIRSSHMEDSLRSLITKYGLNSDNATAFVAEAVRVMVGLTTTNNFKMEVARTTGLDPNTLDALFLDSESTLFKPVRMAIMQALEERKTAIPSVSPVAPLSPVAPSVDPYREPV